MNLNDLFPENEKPLDRLVTDGGFCSVFRTIACIGDSLSSGEFQSADKDGKQGYHDFYEYSWGQYIARAAGCTVYNFSKGGMTAENYIKSFAEEKGYWKTEYIAQAYILALGVNDLLNKKQNIGTVDDIKEDWHENADTFAGYFGAIIQRYKQLQPDARFFLITMPNVAVMPEGHFNEWRDGKCAEHAELMYAVAEHFTNTFVIDLNKYAPAYDKEFRKKFYLGGHMNPMGYILTAQMVMSYIDYIIRHNMDAFKQIGFIGTPYSNPESVK